MKIVKAKPEEAFKVLAFYKSLIEKMQNHPYRPKWIPDVYPSLEDIQMFCEKDALWLMKDEQEILGSVVITPLEAEVIGASLETESPANEKIAEIRLLAVEPLRQGEGLGSILLNHAKQICKEEGYHKIRLETLSDSLPSNQLYQKNGYRLLATESFYFDIAGELEFNIYELDLGVS